MKSQHICKQCNKIFFSYNDNAMYCSRNCVSLSQRDRLECVCEYCGKTFFRKKSEVIKNEHHYCSNECRLNSYRWTKEDIKILEDNYRKIKTSEIQKMLSKPYSLKAINSRAIDFGFAKSRLWTEEELNIIKDKYENVPFREIKEALPNRSVPSILNKARQFGLMSNFYLTHNYSKEELDFLRKHYLEMTNEELGENLGRSSYGVQQKLHLLNLDRPQEIKKDGYKGLSAFVRARLDTWKSHVRKSCNYTCCITGKRSNVVVHHCRSFNLIFEETTEILNFPEYENFSEYSDKQLLQFFDTFYEIQEYYHQYVCVSEDIHILFHSEYGYGDNTEEQWNEFVQKYKNGYYSNIV